MIYWICWAGGTHPVASLDLQAPAELDFKKKCENASRNPHKPPEIPKFPPLPREPPAVGVGGVMKNKPGPDLHGNPRLLGFGAASGVPQRLFVQYTSPSNAVHE